MELDKTTTAFKHELAITISDADNFILLSCHVYSSNSEIFICGCGRRWELNLLHAPIQ